MADESTAPVGVEDDNATNAPEVEGVAPNQPDLEADDTADSDGEDDAEQEPEYDEYDFGGNKLKLPKGSVPDELREQVEKFSKGTWADYTRKSQEVAEARKAVEARESVVTKLAGLSDDLLDTFTYGKQVKAELAQLDRFDLNALWQSDPDQARRISDLKASKQAEFHSVVAQVAQKEQALGQTQAEETARRAEEGKAFINRQVKDFETKHLPELIDYAVKNLGISKEAAASDWALSPAITLAVHKAAMYDKLQAKAATAARPQPNAPAVPMTPVKGNGGTASKHLDLNRDAAKISADEWMRRRNAEIRKRG